jgi:putative peptide zinc metalloprotease protein
MSAAAPCLRSDLSIIAQVYRGQESYVVKDLAAQKYFRFGTTEVRVMRSFDGQRSPAEIAAALASEGLRVSVQAVEAFARQMSSAGFLERSIAERSTLQMERLRAQRRTRQRGRLFRGEILRMRWTFGDPDALLGRVLPYLRWMFTPAFIVASLALFAVYLVVLGQGWSEFTAALAATYSWHKITLASGVTLWITAGAVILIHELGHAFTCKYFGGEVRELGFMLLYFQPAFYCNVSDAWSFPERRARLWVTAAGSWIQIVVASLAAIVWWAAAPGTLAANVGVAAMLVGGLTTLLTNANPLLPLDGYFALADWLEIPNLRHRALAHFNWWLKSRVLRLEVPLPETSPHERRIFMTYGALSALYAAAIFAFLAALVLGWAGQAFGALGIVVAMGGLLLLLRHKIAQLWRTTVLTVRARGATRFTAVRRRRVVIALIVLALGSLLPWTLTSPGGFIVRPVSSRTVTAPDSGVVAQVFVSEGVHVDAGAPLLRLVDRARERELFAAARALDSLTLLESGARAKNRDGDAERLAAERQSAFATLTALERRMSALTVRAASAGVVASTRPEELMGRAVASGDSLLTLAVLDSVELRVALNAGGATRVRAGQTIHVISYGDPPATWTGRVTDISAAGVGANGAGGLVEARVRRAADGAWRPGVTGEASVELQQSTIAAALWWKARQLLRTDLWL